MSKPFSEYLREEQEKEAEGNIDAYGLTETQSPDNAARQIDLARKSGVPRVSVETDQGTYELQDEQRRMRETAKYAPALNNWLAASPDNYAVARDDTEKLTAVETAIAWFKGQPKAAEAAIPGFQAQYYGTRQWEAEQYGEYLSRLKEWKQRKDAFDAGQKPIVYRDADGNTVFNVNPLIRGMTGLRAPDDPGPRPEPPAALRLMSAGRETLGLGSLDTEAGLQFLEKMATLKAPVAEQAAKDARKALDRQKELAPDTGSFIADSLLSGSTSLVNMLPVIGLTAVTKSPSLGSVLLGGQVGGQSYADARAAGKDIRTSEEYAALQAGIETVTERIGLGIIFDKILKKEGAGVLSKFFGGFLTEQVQEQAATLGQDFVDWRYLNPDKPIEEYLSAIPERAAETALATTVAAGGMNATILAVDSMMERRANEARLAAMSEGEGKIEEFLDRVAESALANRSPEKFEEVISAMTKDSGIEEVMIDLDGVIDALYQKGVPTEGLFQELGLDRDSLTEDYQSFGEARVPLSKIATSKTLKENRDAVQPHLRAANEKYTPAQKEAYRKNIDKRLQADVEYFRTMLEDEATRTDEDQAIIDDVREKIVASKAYEGNNEVIERNAIMMAAVSNTLAKRMGVAPREYFDQHFPKIQYSVGGQVLGEGALAQAWEGERVRGFKDNVERGDEPFFDGRLTDFMNKVAEMALNGYSNAEIAEEMETTPASIATSIQVLKRDFGIAIQKSPTAMEKGEDRLRIEELINQGLSNKVIAQRTGKTSNHIGQVRHQMKKAGLLNQISGKGPRGVYYPETNIITLFERRNTSTLMHEMSHWYLRQLEVMAKSPNADPAIVDMLANIEAWYAKLGRKDPNTGKPFVGAARWRDRQETWAESFEKYLETGRAPSIGLRESMRAFKQWMLSLWKYLRSRPYELQRANLNPEVVALFDRMLATDEEIDAGAAMEIRLATEIADALLDQGILTKKEHAKAVKRLPDSIEEVKEERLASLMEDYHRRENAFMQAEKERIRAEVTRAFDQSPVGRALGILGRGVWKGEVTEEGEGLAQGVRDYGAMLDLAHVDPSKRTIARMRGKLRQMGEPGVVRLVREENGTIHAFPGWSFTHADYMDLMDMKATTTHRAILGVGQDSLDNLTWVDADGFVVATGREALYQQAAEGWINAATERTPGTDRQVDAGRPESPVVLADGTVELVHYGRSEGIRQTDPARWGEGGAFLTREERNRIGVAPPRTYFGGNHGLEGGYQKEGGAGDNVYYAYVPFERLYDLAEDPDGLIETARQIVDERRIDVLSAIETAVQEAGYAGYWRAHPGLGMVAAVYEPVDVSNERRSDVEERYKQSGDGVGREEGRGLAPLEGAPTIEGATGPDPGLVSVAEKYAAEKGIDFAKQGEYAKIDVARAERIAAAYDAMEHAPNDPAVRAAYEDLIRQTKDQYEALIADGYEFYFYDETNDPYDGNPWNAMRDLRNNKRMGVFITEGGFGSGATAVDVSNNPLLADTGYTWTMNGQPQRVLANDLFRAVHDAFGHGLEGAGFRARGEENAWQAHVRLFTGPAVGALTSETRGQNSWLNFGPYGESNRTAKVEDTVFADQKTGLMPEWTWTEGIVRNEGDALYQGLPGTPETEIIRAREENAALDHEVDTVTNMLKEAANCLSGAAPINVGGMVAGNVAGLGIGAGLVAPLIYVNSEAYKEKARERAVEYYLQEHQQRMLRDPKYRGRYEALDNFRAERLAREEARQKVAREEARLRRLYSDIDNMPASNQFDMNSWTQDVTGVSAEFLDDLIGHESAGDWGAEAGTSSARGGGQFIDSTWMRLMRKHGSELGLDPGLSRDEILALRNDRRWGTMMTAYYAEENRNHLERRLGRRVTQKDAYLAHFLGATQAVKALSMNPQADAAASFPAAAAANENVFYKNGNKDNPRTVEEMIARQTRRFSSEPLLVWDNPIVMSKADDGRVDR